jgi:hypothetical protein
MSWFESAGSSVHEWVCSTGPNQTVTEAGREPSDKYGLILLSRVASNHVATCEHEVHGFTEGMAEGVPASDVSKPDAYKL